MSLQFSRNQANAASQDVAVLAGVNVVATTVVVDVLSVVVSEHYSP